MQVFLFAAIVIAASSTSALFVDRCNEGPSYWCTDYNTATKCGVLSYCNGLRENNHVRVSDANPVLIELYYESLCGGCRQFILEQLYPAFQKLFSTGIFDIKLYPYGNAQETQNGTKWVFDCQHGEKECKMNLVETCALHLLSHPTQFIPYIHCVENNLSLSNAEACAKNLHVDWEPIWNCYNGSEGNFLEHQMAEKTEALNPPNDYVPWIVVDGEHTEEMQTDAQTDLIDFVCKKYSGTKPHACRVHSKNNKERCYQKLTKTF